MVCLLAIKTKTKKKKIVRQLNLVVNMIITKFKENCLKEDSRLQTVLLKNIEAKCVLCNELGTKD